MKYFNVIYGIAPNVWGEPSALYADVVTKDSEKLSSLKEDEWGEFLLNEEEETTPHLLMDVEWYGSKTNGCTVVRVWEPTTGLGFCTEEDCFRLSYEELKKILDTVHRGKDDCGWYTKVKLSKEGWRIASSGQLL